MAHKLSITNLKKVSVRDSIIVKGRVAPCSRSFSINMGRDDSTYLIQFNPQFQCQEVIYKSKKSGTYSQATRDTVFPFQQNTDVEITFNFNGNKVTVDYPGGHQFHYSSDVNLDHIACISVDGDFEVNSIDLK
ncbi:galectin-1-like [Eublepharis macularius]|uniref:Galectin n=1 Tax=Eublepharis macularius TaxID=481883 RepID=A0AA97KT89_EUBMA|nr:galectin-1-like [Eublepharis macularius]